jgi:hypothetical protein
MGAFRPEMHIIDHRGKLERKQYKTYAELKKDIPKYILQDQDPDGLFVVRAKYSYGWRQYCEYCERWQVAGGVNKQGLPKVEIKSETWS